MVEVMRLPPPPIKPKPKIFSPLRLKIPIRKDLIYATVNRNPHMRLQVPQSPQSPSSFQNGGNLDDLLKDLSLPDTPSNESNQRPDIIVIQSEATETKTPLVMTPGSSRKHRSELSVVLNYDVKSVSQAKIGFEQFLPETTDLFRPLETPTIKVFEEFLPPPPFDWETKETVTQNDTTTSVENHLCPVVDLKRKSRRVSLSFGNPMKKVENRRASIDVVTPSTEAVEPALRRHNSHSINNQTNNNTNNRVDSLKIPTSKGKRRGCDENGVADNGNESNHHHHHHHRRSLSRESSASVATQKSRKISISSQGGSIPWCGCWGNGCF